MARTKNKWTAEEEAALRDGITKHGVGKWRKVLNDPEFSTVLTIRTNVDLKDKWRNMNGAKGDCRSGNKPVQKNIKKPSSHYNQSAALTSEGSGKDIIAQPEPLAIIYESSEDEGSDKLISRFDDSKLNSLINTKQPSSSTPTQEQLPPPNLKMISWGNIETGTANGKLNKCNMEYYSTDSDSMQAAIDAELLRIRQLSPEDAAAAVVAAVNKAKAAIAEAEEAEKVAEEADRDAEEAKSVAEELKRKLEEMKARPAPKRRKQGSSKW